MTHTQFSSYCTRSNSGYGLGWTTGGNEELTITNHITRGLFMLLISFVSLCHVVDHDKRHGPSVMCFSMCKGSWQTGCRLLFACCQGWGHQNPIEESSLPGSPEVEGCVTIRWCLIWKYRWGCCPDFGPPVQQPVLRLLFTWAWLGRRMKPDLFVGLDFFSGFSSVTVEQRRHWLGK